jgi:hypothetical protein
MPAVIEPPNVKALPGVVGLLPGPVTSAPLEYHVETLWPDETQVKSRSILQPPVVCAAHAAAPVPPTRRVVGVENAVSKYICIVTLDAAIS